MLLTITTTAAPATDLGYLLHKHPGRVQSFPQPSGVAHVFYPEATPQRCTAALLLEVDPVALVRGRGGRAQSGGERSGDGIASTSHVNDRPYAASSLLAVALKDVFGTALTGRCAARPELAATPIPLELTVPALPCRGGPELLLRLLEPLGWQVTALPIPLDPTVPAWGDSRYLDVRIAGVSRLADALRQLYVLLPVLDDAKHYWVTTDEIDKLVRAGEGWLADHPEKELISSRYLAHQRSLTSSALARVSDQDDLDPDSAAASLEGREAVDRAAYADETPVSLAEQRRAAVLEAIRAAGATTVGDLGCGEGQLVVELLADGAIRQVIATDVAPRALRTTARRAKLDRMSDRQRQRLALFQSSLTYRDDRLRGLDAAVLMEVVEHVDPSRLPALERCVFGHAAPATVVVTTPNAEHNVRFAALPAGASRHRDHRFEWTRAEFRAWAQRVGAAFGYAVQLASVGPDDPEVGPPTQLALLSRTARGGSRDGAPANGAAAATAVGGVGDVAS